MVAKRFDKLTNSAYNRNYASRSSTLQQSPSDKKKHMYKLEIEWCIFCGIFFLGMLNPNLASDFQINFAFRRRQVFFKFLARDFRWHAVISFLLIWNNPEKHFSPPNRTDPNESRTAVWLIEKCFPITVIRRSDHYFSASIIRKIEKNWAHLRTKQSISDKVRWPRSFPISHSNHDDKFLNALCYFDAQNYKPII